MSQNMLSSFLCASFFFLCFSVQNLVAHGSHDLQTYIVHLEPPSNIKFNRKEEYENWCMSFLPPSYVRAKRLVHIYGEAIHGFAARLTEEEVAHMEKMEGFVSAYLDRVVPLHTTHTPEFLGLTTAQTNHDQVFGDGGKGTIVGVIDTGVTPDHPSFNGGDLPPPPSKWKGECNLPTELCNNKLIGFRSFLQGAMVDGHGKNDVNTTFDDVGHGTHTASTVAGAAVDNANILGEANGTAIGMAPRAHLAIYQVCSDFGCYTSDVLAGINAGIKDEIDVLSISLGGYSDAYYLDAIAIGAFRAMQKGIFVSCSAGNGGPYSYTISNEAPWTLTVGAGSTDRRIRSTVRLGDHQEFEGETLYQPQNFNSTLMRPLVLPNPDDDDHIDIKDKIVFCGFRARFSTVCKDDAVKKVGGAGTIRANTEIRGYNTFARNRSIPSPELNYADGIEVQNYIKATDNPNVTILFKHTVFNVTRSPSMAFFSSRGPGVMSPGILKPDIIGPGLNIIAAFPPREDSRAEAKFSEHSFTIMSGTSMSAPHLSGIVALIKGKHPDWSPAAIKSAIMTTANLLDRDGNSITNEKYVPVNLFAIGAGHVNASNAINPGLIYDITPEDYISFLCQLNYKEKQLTTIVGHKVKCFELKKILIKDLNYPSISVTMEKSHKKKKVIVTRTVTNVGQEKSSYVIKVDEPEGVSITVNPKMLAFSEVNEPITFNVTFEKKGPKKSSYAEGHLSWVSQENDVVVRIPISVKFD